MRIGSDEVGPHATASMSTSVIELLGGYLDDLSLRVERELAAVSSDGGDALGGVAVTMTVAEAGSVTAGASTELAREVDALQYRLGQGPCLDALSGRGGRYVPDLGAETIWGDYGPGAAALGARCCLSVPVTVDGVVTAVAKVYATVVDGLSDEQRRIGVDMATEAAGGIGLGRRLATTSVELDDRVSAMDNRHVIDMAVGVLIERMKIGAAEAFELLRRQSQDSNVKVRAVAVQLLAGAESAAGARDVNGASAGPSGRGDNDAPFRRRGQRS